MASQKKIEANRLNAQKSTGPKTAEGKSIASQNSLKHGLRSDRVLIVSDDPDEFNAHRNTLLEDLAPVGPMETILAERIVKLTWQLNRTARLQACTFNTLIDKEDHSQQQEQEEEKKDSLYYLRVDVLEKAGISEEEYHEIAATKGYEELERIVDQRLLERQLAEQSADDPNQYADKLLGMAIYTDFSQTHTLERLAMYERRIESSLFKTQLQLERLQLRRKANEQKNAIPSEAEELSTNNELRATN